MTALFYLGVHHPHWLATAGVPLFVSRRSLAKVRALPRAAAPWALDSGGFTELSLHGRWTLSARDYANEVRRFRDEVGALAWAAPQDWMCEPAILAKTGLTEEEHQQRTIDNYLELRAIAPDLPWIPVLQGWCTGSHWSHALAYEAAGVALDALPLVGVGTVCRRQGTTGVGGDIGALAAVMGLRLHAFGYKVKGLRMHARYLASADSLAWSYNARRNPGTMGHAHKSCANCLEYALLWREQLLASITRAESAAA